MFFESKKEELDVNKIIKQSKDIELLVEKTFNLNEQSPFFYGRITSYKKNRFTITLQKSEHAKFEEITDFLNQMSIQCSLNDHKLTIEFPYHGLTELIANWKQTSSSYGAVL